MAKQENIDEKLTEEDALKRAAKDGIRFKDFYIVNDANFNRLSSEEFTSKVKAEAWAKKNYEGEYTISQGRTQDTNERTK